MSMISQKKRRTFVPPLTLSKSSIQNSLPNCSQGTRTSNLVRPQGKETSLPTRSQVLSATNRPMRSQATGNTSRPTQSQELNETTLGTNGVNSHRDQSQSEHDSNEIGDVNNRSRNVAINTSLNQTVEETTDTPCTYTDDNRPQSPPKAPNRKSARRQHQRKEFDIAINRDRVETSNAPETNENGGRMPNAPDKRPTRGACRMIKTNRIVRLSKARIKVDYDPKHKKAIRKDIHSLLAHDVGAIIRQHCPMDDGYWLQMPVDKKNDLVSEITVNFDIDTKVPENYDYIAGMMATRYKEFKSELHSYFIECGTPEEALANPPVEMDTRPGQWEFLCKHFLSERFLKQSIANKANRKKRPYEHRVGSCPISYIVEECAQGGSKFPEVDAFEKVYGGKGKNITNDIAKANHEAMVAKKDDYIKDLAKEYPEGTPDKDIIVPDEDAGLKILTSVLGTKPGKQIRGFGGARVHDRTLNRARQLEEKLAVESAKRQAADAALEESQRSLAFMKQSWDQAMNQLAHFVPGFVPPQINIPPQTNSDQHMDEEEEDPQEVDEEEDNTIG